MIGKIFTLLNIDGSILTMFIINFHKRIIEHAVHHNDGSYSPERYYDLVSENGSGWYRVYKNFTKVE